MGIQDNPFGRPLWPSIAQTLKLYAATSAHHALARQTLHAARLIAVYVSLDSWSLV